MNAQATPRALRARRGLSQRGALRRPCPIRLPWGPTLGRRTALATRARRSQVEKGEAYALLAACPIPGCGRAVTDALWRAIVLPAQLRALAPSELLRPYGERDGLKLNAAGAVVVQGKDLHVGLTDERRTELESKRAQLAASALEAQRAAHGGSAAAQPIAEAELPAHERRELRADESKWLYYCCGAAGGGMCDPRAEDARRAEQCADCRSLQSIVALHQYSYPPI